MYLWWPTLRLSLVWVMSAQWTGAGPCTGCIHYGGLIGCIVLRRCLHYKAFWCVLFLSRGTRIITWPFLHFLFGFAPPAVAKGADNLAQLNLHRLYSSGRVSEVLHISCDKRIESGQIGKLRLEHNQNRRKSKENALYARGFNLLPQLFREPGGLFA